MTDEWRLFFALWPDDSTRAALARAIPMVGSGGRAVPVENLHVTLAFLGATDAQRLSDLVALAAGIRAAPFVLTFDRHETWDRSLVVLLPRLTPEPLVQLVRDLNERLTEAELPTDTRHYRAHVTLVRERRRGCGRYENLIAAAGETAAAISVSWAVEDFVLVRSHTRPASSHYEVLQRWRLQPALKE